MAFATKEVRMRRFTLAALVALAVAPQAWGQTAIAYSNTTTFTGSAFPQGGAAADPGQAGNTITRLAADDINLDPAFANHGVQSIQFTVFNGDAANVTARIRMRFWLPDGAGGGPGTFLAGFSFNPISFTGGGQVTIFSAATPFFVPGTRFWAGMSFDDNVGTTGATVANLNNLGQGIFNPPTVGSSADQFFLTTANGSFLAN